jgi:hypothetical protein
VLQDECLTPFYLSPTQNILPFTQLVLKLAVCVWTCRDGRRTGYTQGGARRAGDKLVQARGRPPPATPPAAHASRSARRMECACARVRACVRACVCVRVCARACAGDTGQRTQTQEETATATKVVCGADATTWRRRRHRSVHARTTGAVMPVPRHLARCNLPASERLLISTSWMYMEHRPAGAGGSCGGVGRRREHLGASAVAYLEMQAVVRVCRKRHTCINGSYHVADMVAVFAAFVRCGLLGEKIPKDDGLDTDSLPCIISYHGSSLVGTRRSVQNVTLRNSETPSKNIMADLIAHMGPSMRKVAFHDSTSKISAPMTKESVRP